MEIGQRLKRLIKLGLFVGLGATTALVAACKSETSPQPDDLGASDAGKVDQRVVDSGPADQGADMAASDTGKKPDSARDTRGWDIPLE